MKNTEYNPKDIEQHIGRSYKTQNGSTYSFDSDGRFRGRDSIEGAQPEMVAGLDTQYETQINFPDPNVGEKELLKYRKNLAKLVKKYGEEPVEGKHLVLVLPKPTAIVRNRIGFKSSPLEAGE